MTALSEHTHARGLTKLNALVVLFSVDSLVRAMANFIVPLHVYNVWREYYVDDADSLVGATFTAVSIVSFALVFVAPLIIHRFGSRQVYVATLTASVLGLAAFATSTLSGMMAGVVGRSIYYALGGVCLTLFIIDNIGKDSLVRLETKRRFFSTFAWIVGPVVGAALYHRFGIVAPALIAGMVHLGLLFYARQIDLAATTRNDEEIAVNPIAFTRRFMAQGRMRLSWLLGFGRCLWWSLFFTYPTLYLISQGFSEQSAGWLIAVGNALTIFSPLVRRGADAFGVRPMIIASFATAGTATLGVFVFYSWPLVAIALLVLGAGMVSILDSLYSIPFMRFVRHREKPQMTAVYLTFSDIGEILMSSIYGLLLLSFDFRAVFAMAGAVTVAIAVVATRLPRGL